MAYGSNITTSVLGRRLGLQIMSTAQTGSANGAQEFIVGPNDIRLGATTADTTSTATKPHGISILVGTSVASTPVYSLDPPIPGVRKIIVFGSTDSALYLKTKNAEQIWGSSLGSSATVIRSSGGGCVELIGLTTAAWAAINISSSAVNGCEFQATT